MGLQLGVVPSWKHRASSMQGLPAGMVWISEAIEVQALAAPHTQQQPETALTDAEPLSAAVVTSSIDFHLTGAHIAAVLSVGDALAAEAARGFREPLPPPGMPSFQSSLPFRVPWLSAVALQADGCRAAWCSGSGANPWELSTAPDGQPHADARLQMHCEALSTAAAAISTAAAGPAGLRPFLMLGLQHIDLAVDDSTALSIAAGDVRCGQLPSQAVHWQATQHTGLMMQDSQRMAALPAIRTGASPAVQQQSSVQVQAFVPMAFSDHIAGPSIAQTASLVLEIGIRRAHNELMPDVAADRSLHLSCKLEAVSCSLQPEHLGLVAEFAQQAIARPALPAVLSFPPVALKNSLPIELDMQVGMVSGQLHCSGDHSPADLQVQEGIAGHLQDLSCQFRIHITWVSERTCSRVEHLSCERCIALSCAGCWKPAMHCLIAWQLATWPEPCKHGAPGKSRLS